MDKQSIAAYFDSLAPNWDAGLVRNEPVIDTILTGAGVREGTDVLDVACGTGVLIADYLARGARSVTAIDISPGMAEIARAKFPQKAVTVLCGDVETAEFGQKFDCVMVYNAFPHFADPARLIGTLAGLLKPGGTLTVAHGMSRAAIDRHHSGQASAYSRGLMDADTLAALFARHLVVTVKISDERMYQVTGRKLA